MKESPRRARVELHALTHATRAGCGARPAPRPPPPLLGGAAQASSPSASSSPASLPADYHAAYRRLLEQMVSVDTSHGDETKLLEPIAALYRDAGVAVQILESAPGRGNLVARLKGSGAKKPLLLLAHVDVVPVEGQPWTVPPFAVTEKDGFLYGRGINDDKGMAAAIVALTLDLARTRAPLTRDVIVALTSSEESGAMPGARWLVENHKDLLDAEIALNEGGGMLVTDDFAKPVLFGVGVSEKVFQTFKLVVKGKGGHSSRPPTTGDPVVTLARALLRVGEHRFPAKMLPEVKADLSMQLATAEPAYVEALRHAFASAPRVDPLDDAVLSKDAIYNAEIRTTCVTTMLKGSPQDNVLPTTAEAWVNCRILPGETREGTRAALAAAISDPTVGLTLAEDSGDAPGTPFEGEVPAAVEKVVGAAYAGTPVVPGMSTGASDSRFLRGAGIRAYGVSPGVSTRAEGKAAHLAHGPDERRSVPWLAVGTDLFRDIVRALVL